MTARRVIRCALTQTKNAYLQMPSQTADLPSLRDKMEDIRMANVTHNIDLISAAAAHGVSAAVPRSRAAIGPVLPIRMRVFSVPCVSHRSAPR